MIDVGTDLARSVVTAAAAADYAWRDGDVVVVAQKIISKSEGRLVRLDAVEPGPAALELAAATDKDPRLVQLILDESSEVMRSKPGVIIVRHRLGHVGANAGIDQSNIEHDGGECALLLPVDPDASAVNLRAALLAATGVQLGVIVADSMNRPWRLGTVGNAIGAAGVAVLDDLRGKPDLYGREMRVAMVNRADSLAAAACLLMGESIERTPVVVISDLPPCAAPEMPVAGAVRPLADDLFR